MNRAALTASEPLSIPPAPKLPRRLMVRLRTLTPSIVVRIHAGHPLHLGRVDSVLLTASRQPATRAERRSGGIAGMKRSCCLQVRSIASRPDQTPVANPARKAA